MSQVRPGRRVVLSAWSSGASGAATVDQTDIRRSGRHHSYASWYSNGVVALDLSPLNQATPGDPVKVGQFLPAGGTSKVPGFIPSGIPIVWSVAIRPSDNVVFVSDMNSGLWIVRPTGPAAP